jgi:cytochrome c biogenesis protein
MPAEKHDLFKDLWDFFCSLKLTVITLLLLAATSVVGTILPQHLSPDQYRQQFGEPGFKLLQALQLFDMYHSWWFLGLLGIFALNLTACSLRRLPGVWRNVTRPASFAEKSLLRSLPNRQDYDSSLPAGEIRLRLEKVIRRHFGSPKAIEKDGSVTLFAQCRIYARFSVYVTHLSILLILLGAVIGSLWGFKSFVTIVEGNSVDSVPSPTGGPEIPLDFTLRCDDFFVSFYDEAQTRPKEYRSLLTILESGREMPGYNEVPVRVNHPLHFQGLHFYQSSWGKTTLFRFLITRTDGGDETTVEGYPGQIMALPDGGAFQVIDFYSAYRDLGPAALLAVRNFDGQVYGAVAATAGPGPVMVASSPYRFRLLNSEERLYTGLQVSRDPGVPVVWAGCILLVVGSLCAFFLSHQRLWLVIRPKGEGCEVSAGAGAHRNQPAMARKFDRFSRDIAAELEDRIEGVPQEEKG